MSPIEAAALLVYLAGFVLMAKDVYRANAEQREDEPSGWAVLSVAVFWPLALILLGVLYAMTLLGEGGRVRDIIERMKQ